MNEDTRTFKVSVEGKAPFIMHNSEGANPSNKWTLLAAPLKKKGNKKTDAEHKKLNEINFLSSLYWSSELDGLYMPTDNVRKMILEAGRALDPKGAKKQVVGVFFSEYLGYQFMTKNRSDMELLKDDTSLRYFKIVTIGRAKVPSVRAQFKEWSFDFEIEIDASIVNPETVFDWLEYAGKRIGLGARRPYAPTPGPFGTFTITEFKEVKGE